MDMAPDIIAVTGMAIIIAATAIVMGVATTMAMAVAAIENRSAKNRADSSRPFLLK
jgi:multisubunit Na+/H+ antiporter MnhC subunit